MMRPRSATVVIAEPATPKLAAHAVGGRRDDDGATPVRPRSTPHGGVGLDAATVLGGHIAWLRWVLTAGLALGACTEPTEAAPSSLGALVRNLVTPPNPTGDPGDHKADAPASSVDRKGLAPSTAQAANLAKGAKSPPASPAQNTKHKRPRNGRSESHDKKEAPRRETSEDSHGLANGIACIWDSDCASGSCTYRVCHGRSDEEQLGNGVKCTWDSQCASHECMYGLCRSKSDEEQLGNGVKCTWDSQCASHHCTYSVCQGGSDW